MLCLMNWSTCVKNALIYTSILLKLYVDYPVRRKDNWNDDRRELVAVSQAGPSRATAGPGNILTVPIRRKKNLNGAFWCTLYFWAMAGPPNIAGSEVTCPFYPHLDGPGRRTVTVMIERQQNHFNYLNAIRSSKVQFNGILDSWFTDVSKFTYVD